MSSKGQKAEFFFNDEQLPEFFRKLADALEDKSIRVDNLPDLDEFSSVKIGIKRRFEQNVVKIKVKKENIYATTPKTSPVPGYPIKYKNLKKRMKGDFKHIIQAIYSNQLPPEAIVRAFLSDSKLMVSFPGKGDEYYREYTSECEKFRQAYEDQDMAALKQSVDKLNTLKKDCHNRYK